MHTNYFKKLSEQAVKPWKAHPEDIGYELTLIDYKGKGKLWDGSESLVDLFGTGLKIKPPAGWTWDIGPRSSITKSGYLLANSTGYIDPIYRGEFLVALYKYDQQAKDLELPARVVQLIPRQIAPDFDWVETNDLDKTDRETGGFGSTGY